MHVQTVQMKGKGKDVDHGRHGQVVDDRREGFPHSLLMCSGYGKVV